MDLGPCHAHQPHSIIPLIAPKLAAPSVLGHWESLQGIRSIFVSLRWISAVVDVQLNLVHQMLKCNLKGKQNAQKRRTNCCGNWKG